VSKRKEVQMRDQSESTRTGRSFELPHLLIAQAWAEYHGLSLTIELDRVIDGVACEEVLCFAIPRFRSWTMWHSGADVIALPDSGLPVRFASLPDALEGLGLEEIILST
jgi:hypothetical protein